MPAWIPAAISGAAGLIGSLLGNKQRSKEYEKQKRDSIEFWNLQNEYNHPKNQVKRIKEAGLSPALLYGQSAGGVSGQAGNIDTPDLQSTAYRNPFESIPSSIADYADIRIKQAQSDLLSAQVEKLDIDTAHERAKTIGQRLNNRRTAQEVEEYLYETNVQQRAKVRKYNAMKAEGDAWIKKMEADIMSEGYQELKQKPKYERMILQERLRLITKTADWKETILDNYERLMDPKFGKDLLRILLTEFMRSRLD
jgi:hypothetical protein